MLYKDDVKREVLQNVKNKIEITSDENDLFEQIFSKIEGTNKDRQNLFTDCKAYLFLNTIFENNPELAIELAEKYIKIHSRDINLVDEKLLTFYIKLGKQEKANELVEKLLIKEPDNKWTLSKKINMLRIKGKYDEGLRLIDEKYEIIKNDPIIFDIQYKILCKTKRNDLDAILDFFEERIPNLNFGNEQEHIKKYLPKLSEYTKKTYQIEEKVKNKEKLGRVRGIIKQKRKKETKKLNISKDDTIYNLEIVKQINTIMQFDKGKLEIEEIQKLINQISDENIAFFIACQIEHFNGKKAEDIAKKVKNYQKNAQLDEKTRKLYRMLQNFLTSKDAKFYLHSKWINLQKLYFIDKVREKGIINKGEQLNRDSI